MGREAGREGADMSRQRFVLGSLVGLACGLPTMVANGQGPAAPLGLRSVVVATEEVLPVVGRARR